ncbi:DUF2207 domain-containing protein [Kiloniella laminariae]|uniref:DUF2207 domain-containing protein n=1 Tax=Kiloniella laminariae TaxID=454162 RepID=A0ABT4LMP3_9PROT|nr:DUF2207 domain-containing protein [Kiloniella laminariae]MCZ4281232.1 DUF2207 domain-containing protein [Kiloniella laminariae]
MNKNLIRLSGVSGLLTAFSTALFTVFCTVLFLALNSGEASASAGEKIQDFTANIVIQRDGSLLVTETIKVYAEGDQIKRGIYREFPTKYTVKGSKYHIGFELLSVRRDGRRESYFTEDQRNGIRVYIGDRNYFLPEGEYSYEIQYRTTRQLTYLDGFDELYWNVTGNGWELPIEKVTANVFLPEGADILNHTGYTGYSGDSGSAYHSFVSRGLVTFQTTERLYRNQGLTVAVSWPKGFVEAPSPEELAKYFYKENTGLLFGGLGLVITLGYFLLTWIAFGRDPKGGVVIPLFSAPKDLSPAAVGFLAHGGFRSGFDRKKAFSVALISLAAKGYLSLSKELDGYLIKRLLVKGKDGPDRYLSPGEEKILNGLIPRVGDQHLIEQVYRSSFSKVYDAFTDILSKGYEKGFFSRNFGTWLFGAILGGLSIAIAVVFEDMDNSLPLLFMLFFMTMFLGIFLSGIKHWLGREMLQGGVPKDQAEILSLAVFLIIPVAACFVAAQITDSLLSDKLYILIVVIYAVVLLFHYLMEAPTVRGRKMMDEIEGYKHYLTVAEKDRLALIGEEPELTKGEFERHLPFAMALGVEKQWCERLESVVWEGSEDQGQAYQPGWYEDHSSDFRYNSGIGGLVSGIESGLSHTVSSASTPPSSSSSSSGGFSSGGGSSGGGGGGGGGGGW